MAAAARLFLFYGKTISLTDKGSISAEMTDENPEIITNLFAFLRGQHDPKYPTYDLRISFLKTFIKLMNQQM